MLATLIRLSDGIGIRGVLVSALKLVHGIEGGFLEKYADLELLIREAYYSD